MRLSTCVVPAFLVLAASGFATAQGDNKTDLQRDELMGTVKSVVSARLSEASKDVQKRINFSITLGCGFCEYDREGNRLTSGQILDGKFVGDRTIVSRNPNGLVERVSTSDFGPFAQASSLANTIVRTEVVGPYGMVELSSMQGDKLSFRLTMTYDAKGHLAETHSFDGNGVMTGHEIYQWTADGERTALANYVAGDVLRSRLTWDPQTDQSKYSCFDESGALLENWTITAGVVMSYWAASDRPCGPGVIFESDPNGKSRMYNCRQSTGCKVEHAYSTWYGPGKQHIRHTDFFDPAGTLMWKSDYEYEFDTNNNWTHRKVWVTIPGESSPILFCEDARTITYWDK